MRKPSESKSACLPMFEPLEPRLLLSADLTCGVTSYPAGTYAPGDSADAYAWIQNIGDDNAPGTFYVDAYLSLNQSFDAGTDIRMFQQAVDTGLPAGMRVPTVGGDTYTVTIPDGTAAGSYYVLLVIDSTGVVAESSESNNVWASASKNIVVTEVPTPDLAVLAADSEVWQSAETGTLVNWTATVKNNGTISQLEDWTVQWYLSSDSYYQATDTLVGSETYSEDIGPGVSVSKIYNAAVPAVATAGQKYVIGRVVNAGPDGSASNNVKSSTDRDWFGVVAPDSDDASSLNDSLATATDLGYVAWTSIRSGLTLDNTEDCDFYKFTTQGPSTSSHYVRVNFTNAEGDLYLKLYDDEGTQVGSTANTTGNSERISLNALAEGSYYLEVGANGDDVSRNYALKIIASAGPDLKMTAADSSVWQSAEPGTLADWTATVKNIGVSWQLSDWTVEWYLSSNTSYQTTDTLVGRQTYSDEIAPGASVSKTYNGAVPVVATAGQMYVIGRVVNAGPDGSSRNNVKASADRDWFGVVNPDSDDASSRNDSLATATDIGYVAWTSTRTGLTLDNTEDCDFYKFTTLGPSTSSSYVRIDFNNAEGDLYLSLNLYRGDGTLVRSTANETGKSEKIGLNTLAEGTYYVEVGANNGDISRNYTLKIVAPAGPDLTPTAADSSVWQSAEPGTLVNWTATVKNGGVASQHADWTVEWYLSSNTTYQTTDTLVGRQTYSDDIAPGASVSKTYNAAAPVVATAGQMYVIARVVNAGPDGSTRNNVRASADRDWFGLVALDSDDAVVRNDALLTATNLGSVTGTLSRLNRTLDVVDLLADVDYYKFTTTKVGGVNDRVRIDFINAEGDLTLNLLDSGGAVLLTSDSSNNYEQISLNGLLAGDYYFQVLGKNGDISRDYDISLRAPV